MTMPVSESDAQRKTSGPPPSTRAGVLGGRASDVARGWNVPPGAATRPDELSGWVTDVASLDFDDTTTVGEA